jgi:hypothetical protein
MAMRSLRLALVVLGAGSLAACGFLPPSEQQQFDVSAAAPSQGVFRNADSNLNDTLAQGICATGYEKLNQSTLPAESGSLDVVHVRCAPYPDWYLNLF